MRFFFFIQASFYFLFVAHIAMQTERFGRFREVLRRCEHFRLNCADLTNLSRTGSKLTFDLSKSKSSLLIFVQQIAKMARQQTGSN